MSSSSPRLLFVARAVLFIGCCLVATLMLGPFQGAEKLFGLRDKQAHALAFFAFVSVCFVAFPRMRRTDLALAAVALGAASEIAQAVVGRDAGAGDVIADAVGVLMALAPTYIEGLRAAARGEAPRYSRRQSDRRARQALARAGLAPRVRS